jgi:hypothetical protein
MLERENSGIQGVARGSLKNNPNAGLITCQPESKVDV